MKVTITLNVRSNCGEEVDKFIKRFLNLINNDAPTTAMIEKIELDLNTYYPKE